MSWVNSVERQFLPNGPELTVEKSGWGVEGGRLRPDKYPHIHQPLPPTLGRSFVGVGVEGVGICPFPHSYRPSLSPSTPPVINTGTPDTRMEG